MQTAPLFSLVYTSVRPNCILPVYNMWMQRAKNPAAVEWVINTHKGYNPQATAVAEALAAERPDHVKSVVNTGLPNCVTGWNNAAAHSRGMVIIAVADDFIPPVGWDESLLALKPDNWWLDDHVVHVEDGYVHDIMVLSMLTRKRYERFGYVFYPKYVSMFCDTEFTEVARREGVVIEAKHLLFEHMHPDCAKRPRDHNDVLHASKANWNTGEMIFNFRKAAGFPVDDGPRAVAEGAVPAPAEPASAPGDIKFAVYMQVIKDDFCLYEVCRRMMDEGCLDFFWAVPDTYWSGEAVSVDEHATLGPILGRLRSEGARVNMRVFKVANYRIGSESRITVETRLRNDSLAWVRESGFPHVLIVDGDELWKPGTLDIVRPFVIEGHAAISVGMTPVMGTPGYPVDGAGDVAVVYIGPSCTFRVCRSPSVQQTIIHLPQVIHFTSTRKTAEENIAKHRRSGHYDDPEYAFEDWIANKLPKAQPGLQDAHMYTKRSIWPVLRNWRPEELAVIPASLHPFLGTPKA